jgi:hypothetical protein
MYYITGVGRSIKRGDSTRHTTIPPTNGTEKTREFLAAFEKDRVFYDVP